MEEGEIRDGEGERDAPAALSRAACLIGLHTLLRLAAACVPGRAGEGVLLLSQLLPLCLYGWFWRPARRLVVRQGARARQGWRVLLLLLPVLLLSSLLLSRLGGELAGVAQVPTVLPVGAGAWLWYVVRHALLPAVLEECLYRGAFFSLLWEGCGRTALWLSALLFAVSHAPYAWPYALVGGCLLAIAARKSGSLWAPVLLHAANNAASLGLSVLTMAYPAVPIWGGAVAACAALSVPCAVWCARHARALSAAWRQDAPPCRWYRSPLALAVGMAVLLSLLLVW